MLCEVLQRNVAYSQNLREHRAIVHGYYGDQTMEGDEVRWAETEHEDIKDSADSIRLKMEETNIGRKWVMALPPFLTRHHEHHLRQSRSWMNYSYSFFSLDKFSPLSLPVSFHLITLLSV